MKQNIKTLLNMINQIKYILNHKQKRKAIIILFSILVGAMFETLGVTAIIPFIQSMLTPELLLQNQFVKSLAQIFIIETPIQLIIFMGVAIIIVYIVKNLYLALAAYAQTLFQCKLQKELSVTMLQSYMRRPYLFFLQTNSSEILRGINSDISGIYAIISSGFKLIAELLTIILIGIFLIYTDPIMAFGILLLAGSCLLIVTGVFHKKLTVMGAAQRKYTALRTQSAYQAITGIKEIIVMHREEKFALEYEEFYNKQVKADVSYNFSCACPERIIEAVCVGGLIGVVCFRLALGGDATSMVPQLGAFAVAAFRILPSVSRIVGYFNAIVFYRITLESTYSNLAEVREYEVSRQAYKIAQQSIDPMNVNMQKELQNQVIVQGVWWKYPGGTEHVLSELDITIHKGESVALIGSSGAGKTTLADIILGLLQPEQGTVKVDGTDIFTIPEIWSKIIGYVPQTVFLLDDTIRNNVTFGIGAEECDDELVWKALEQAQLKCFVAQQPKGLDTVVGERGVKFSGGQRQRVAIARALYYNPDILVLDEATSALDTETETAVMESIDALQGHKTLIIVAHRLTTISNCDKIYEIVDGKAYMRTKEEIF